MLSQSELLAMPADTYMNEVQQAFFRQLLLDQRSELQRRIDEEFGQLREQQPASDPADLGSAEEQRQWQLRLLERLARGEYGWCSETGGPIGLRRLLLRPTASLCIEAKERQEQRERHIRDVRGNPNG